MSGNQTICVFFGNIVDPEYILICTVLFSLACYIDLFFITDVIGVCKSMEEVTRLTTKSNKEVSKRTLSLMDMSGKVVTVTLWGEEVSTDIRWRVTCVMGRRIVSGAFVMAGGNQYCSLVMQGLACCNGEALFSEHLSFQRLIIICELSL